MDDISYLGASNTVCSYNLFIYCENNPIMYVDESGHAVIACFNDLFNIFIGGRISNEYSHIGARYNYELYNKSVSVDYITSKKYIFSYTNKPNIRLLAIIKSGYAFVKINVFEKIISSLNTMINDKSATVVITDVHAILEYSYFSCRSYLYTMTELISESRKLFTMQGYENMSPSPTDDDIYKEINLEEQY